MDKKTINQMILLGMGAVGVYVAYKAYFSKPKNQPEEKSNLFGWGNCIGRNGRPTPCFGKEKYTIHKNNFK